MEEENLTYRKCCTTRSHRIGIGFWRIARHRCRLSLAASGDVLTRSLSPLTSNVYILISLQSETRAALVVLGEFGTDRA